MIRKLTDEQSLCRWIVGCSCWLACAGLTPIPVVAQPLEAKEELFPAKLSLNAAVRWALQNNPELAALRQQHGIAAAAVVIAETYPFNPIWEAKVGAADGAVSD